MPSYRRSASLSLSLTLALALSSAGCGERGPTLVPVTGTVSFNGEPLEGADVTFIPDAGNAEPTSGGALSGPQGHFQMRYRDRDGLAPGKYKVLVAKKFFPKGVKIPDSFKDDPGMLALPEMGFTKESLPTNYLDPAKTPLSVEVTAAQGTYDFDVKGKPVKP